MKTNLCLKQLELTSQKIVAVVVKPDSTTTNCMKQHAV